ncbi:MAG: PEP-CTERM sorting domain-containing protein, partial [Pirellulales bacterium]|nr:PEP-CTERM sorting domain-containing protein [Pirellulales bacterium]
FTVGRGMFGGGITDWSDALIDEVRISDTALPLNQFLFVAVPEPATGAMLAAALGAVGLRRRRVGG